MERPGTAAGIRHGLLPSAAAALRHAQVDLRHPLVKACSGEKPLWRRLHENMEQHPVIVRICGVPVPLPVPGIGVNLYGALLRFPPVNTHGRIDKIRPGHAIPDAELDDPHRLAIRPHNLAPKLA